jgi:histidyl-tRNA synthetase (EC 6.1.1.21)
LFGVDQVADSLALAAELRATGINTVIALEPGNISKQFKEADRRGVRFALVLGPDELARGEVVVKDLQRGEQRSLPRAAAISLLAEALNEGK